MIARTPVVAIVGAGFSGTVTAIELLRRAAPGTRVLLIERAGTPGHGIAYGTRDGRHRLNVAAARMSALADAPDDLVAWSGARPTAFLPRREYGAYLRARLAQAAAASRARLEHVAGAVVRIRQAPGALELRLAGGQSIACDRAVLAPGWLPGAPPVALPDDPRAIADPWAPGALEGFAPDRLTLLIGTGPTAIDVALTAAAAPGARVVAVSRHGRLPFPHLPGLRTPAPAPDLGSGPLRLDAAAARLRRHAAALRPRGFDWRDVVDGLRPHVPALWARMPLDDKRRFVAGGLREWEVRRHRLAPAVGARVDRLRAERRLRVLAARVQRVRATPAGLEVVLGDGTALRADRVVVCAGTGAPVVATTDPLVRDLLATGLAVPDALGLGLRTARDGALLDRRGVADARIWTLGPLRRGELWESTAVPELREQAAVVAAQLLRSLRAAPAAISASS